MNTLVEYKRGFYVDLDYCDCASIQIGGVIILSHTDHDKIKIDSDELFRKAQMVIVRYAKSLNVKPKPATMGRTYNLYEGRIN